MYRESRLSPPEKKALASATLFVATAFLGSSKYARAEAHSFPAALALAPSVYQNDGRGVAIYAVAPDGSQAMLGYWAPDTTQRKAERLP